MLVICSLAIIKALRKYGQGGNIFDLLQSYWFHGYEMLYFLISLIGFFAVENIGMMFILAMKRSGKNIF